MDFKDKVQDGISKGIDTSKKLYNAAREKVKDLTELGVATIELNQLEASCKDLNAQLGEAVFACFSAEGVHSIERDDTRVAKLLKELAELKTSITEKREEIKNMKKSDKID
jgi:hypothetical protein